MKNKINRNTDVLLKTVLFFYLFVTTYSCKKGENDPFLSLRSRKARLTGEWTVVSAKGIKGDTLWEYDGTDINISVDTIAFMPLPVTIEYTFSKEGSFIKSVTTNYPKNWTGDSKPAYTLTETVDGIWNFTGGAGNTKAKSQLLLQDTSYSRTTTKYDNVTILYQGQPNGRVYDINELRNNKMVLRYEYIVKYPGETYNETEEWTLNKK